MFGRNVLKEAFIMRHQSISRVLRCLAAAGTLSVFAAAGVAPAAAQGRPSTTAMSCAQAQASVRAAGAIVLGTGPDLYDRYVISRAYCTPSERTQPAWAPTRDDRQCFIGFRCEEITQDDFAD
jgi:hypothetical protein